MGASFSSFNQSSSHQKLSKESSNDQNSGLVTSIINFMKPRCLCRDEEKEQQLQPVNEAKAQTLEEWLLASPSLDNNCSNGGACYLHRSLSSKVHVRQSLSVDEGDNMSNSLESLLKVDEVEHEELSRSQSGKAKKRVSFKLPEEADIFIFCSPTEKEFGE